MTRGVRVFSYVTLGSEDLQRSAVFYDAVLAPLGIYRCATPGEEDPDWLGWGHYEREGQFELALWLCKPYDGNKPSAGNGTMIAFSAPNWAAVQDFHAQALRHGGTSEGEPGLRVQYNPDFYAAYVRDPDGHKLAAICRGPTHEGLHPL